MFTRLYHESQVIRHLCDYRYELYKEPGVYIDTLTGMNGCDSIRTLHLKENMFYLPNVFSPNDDNINDIISLISKEGNFKIDYFAIFDKFGGMMFESKNADFIWTGTNKQGKQCHTAVYTYVLLYEYSGQKIEHGSITLLR